MKFKLIVMNNLINSFFLLASFTGMAQTFAPLGAEWTIGYTTPGSVPFTFYDAYRTIQVSDEQMKEGKHCQVIVGECEPHSPNRGSDTNYVYTEDEAVYAWYSQENRFQKVFDFGEPAGTSWDVLISEPQWANGAMLLDTFRITIDSTYVELLNGVSTDSYNFSMNYLGHDSSACESFYDYSIEGLKANSKLGFESWLFPVINALCVTDPYSMMEISPITRCYQDDEVTYSNLGSIPSCYYQNVGVEESNQMAVEINVNSAQGILQIKNWNVEEPFQIHIYNRAGQLLINQSDLESIDVSGYTSGIYLVKLFNTKKTHTQKVLIN